MRRFDPRRDGAGVRRHRPPLDARADLVALVWMLRQMVDRAGSIEGFFLEGYDPAADDVGAALDSFSTRALALDLAARLRPRADAARASATSFRGPRRAAAASG